MNSDNIYFDDITDTVESIETILGLHIFKLQYNENIITTDAGAYKTVPTTQLVFDTNVLVYEVNTEHTRFNKKRIEDIKGGDRIWLMKYSGIVRILLYERI